MVTTENKVILSDIRIATYRGNHFYLKIIQTLGMKDVSPEVS